MHKISFLWTALLSLMAASCGVAPTNLKCEYQENDVLVDTQAPRLSWLNSEE